VFRRVAVIVSLDCVHRMLHHLSISSFLGSGCKSYIGKKNHHDLCHETRDYCNGPGVKREMIGFDKTNVIIERHAK